MNPQQAQNLVKPLTSTLQQWVCDHCGKDEHLIPLALLYIHQRLSEQDWQVVRQYDEQQPFEAFIRELVQDAMETFFHGVWFGECAKTINYWITRYGVKNVSIQQDAEDYVKNKLTKDNFSRFRSYNKDKETSFNTYISKVIRNLVIDYLRRKTPLRETESLESAVSGDDYNDQNTMIHTSESYQHRHLEEIGQWFFPGESSQEMNPVKPIAPDIPDEIKLGCKERLFLRAMYKDGLTVEEAGRLPGINMGKWQAHGYHRRLKKRIKKLLQAMGYETLQSLLYSN